jgi:hypothetical protein
MVTKEFLTTTIEKVKDEIKDMMNEKIDKLESKIFDLELSKDKLKQENDIMKNHISRQEDRMDGLEDGLNRLSIFSFIMSFISSFTLSIVVVRNSLVTIVLNFVVRSSTVTVLLILVFICLIFWSIMLSLHNEKSHFATRRSHGWFRGWAQPMLPGEK